MLGFTPNSLRDLNQAFTAAPGGFVIVEQGMPKFVVLDYDTFKSLQRQDKTKRKVKKVLVTGGAGYIGAVTVQVLRSEGYDVTVFDNLSTGKREAVKDCRLIVADLADRGAIDKAFTDTKFDAIIHFAASVEVEESVRNPAKYYQNNFVNGVNLLDAMVEHGVSRLVFSSTAAVYGDPVKMPVTEETPPKPTNPYGETKLAFERMLSWYSQSYGVHSVTLRYFNAAGAWPEQGLGYNNFGKASHLIPRVLDVAAGRKEEIAVYGNDYATHDGTGIRDYIHVRDLAKAHVLALKKLEGANGVYVYNVGTGQGNSVLEVIDEAVEVTGRMVPLNFAPRREGDPAKLVADATKLKKEFGWQPRHTLRDIMESSWAWHKSRSKN